MQLNTLHKKHKFPSKRPELPKSNIPMGWLTPNNIILLNKYLKNKCGSNKSVVLELGVWLGMSTRLIASQISEDSTVICVDWWKGDSSIGNKASDEDELYNRYIDNVWDYRKKIIPVRMDGRDALKYLSKSKIAVDLIYLDMGHSYKEVYGDLVEIMKYYPDVIIVGDDYLFWSGVKKAVHDIRIEYKIPFLDVDKNCYALVPLQDRAIMTYDNDIFGSNINKLKEAANKRDKEQYKFEELQYSFILDEVKCKKRVYIISIKDDITDKVFKSNYKNIATSVKDGVVIFIRSVIEINIYMLYNIGYLYYTKHNTDSDVMFFFIDNTQVVDSKSYKCVDGVLSITSLRDLSIDVYANHGTLGIGSDMFKKLDGFPYIKIGTDQHGGGKKKKRSGNKKRYGNKKNIKNHQLNNHLHRYFFNKRLMEHKIVLSQQYSASYGGDTDKKNVIVEKMGAIIDNKELINNKNYLCNKCKGAEERYSAIRDAKWVAMDNGLFQNKLHDVNYNIVSDTKLGDNTLLVVDFNKS